ncbi:MCE family protein [Mycolicibacterium thermoresistibile]|uniref:Virulence factor mce family protein n=2 Tax=Mycolicibacterium thermoresistibile TaxID=1797 RepID=G7CN05_MYCT3|nr:MlaD family protein [Mycolicibacterium thermoresistibile]EHI10494.1 virulence factor mce family protein [Mycolicibacterium thermoresistibile ATCC 19527]MCV7189633.1 MCE family protein [Mycolicibacterium thermoresistibile]GAT15454.1 virulence factor Mce family protein [Mycolicibacterium thermoresistibile]SNW17513.1 Virulence factor Mce family protein [Mycolicibacterium thermoresistibile]
MLTRFVRTQLVIFVISSIIGMAVMGLVYMQIPTLLGIGRITVQVELPDTGGLYRFGNVTMRGVKVGKVTGVGLRPTSAVATLSLESSARIPADLTAEVRSISAVGEQYIDLLPRRDGPPYLRDGSVIPAADVRLPQQVGPMLDQVSALLDTIPRDQLQRLIDESYTGLSGAGYELGSLFDSSARVSADIGAVSERLRDLVDGAAPLTDSQVQTTEALRTLARSSAGITGQVRRNDPDVRRLLADGPGLTTEVSALLAQVKPTLPVLLANLVSVGQVGVTYRNNIRQLMVMLPLTASGIQSYAAPNNNPTGIPLSEFAIGIADPPVCTVGFLPPSEWRSPDDTSEIDTPEGLYCKLPQDSPISVRGVRNSPCVEHPGKRAPTVEICNSDRPFVPLAMRQHALGPYPFDPNLIAQGIPVDSRVTDEDHLYGPIGGTPMPAGTPPPELPPPPSVAVAPYNPQTGQYTAPDGSVGYQHDLVRPATSPDDLFPR